MILSIALSIAFIALAPIPWWAVVVIWHALRRDPSVDALREQGQRFTMAGLAGVAVSALGASYLAGLRGLPQLPHGVGFALLAGALLAIYAQPAWFLIRHYRRR